MAEEKQSEQEKKEIKDAAAKVHKWLSKDVIKTLSEDEKVCASFLAHRIFIYIVPVAAKHLPKRPMTPQQRKEAEPPLPVPPDLRLPIINLDRIKAEYAQMKATYEAEMEVWMETVERWRKFEEALWRRCWERRSFGRKDGKFFVDTDIGIEDVAELIKPFGFDPEWFSKR